MTNVQQTNPHPVWPSSLPLEAFNQHRYPTAGRSGAVVVARQNR